jgi:hypothetical protein
MNLFLWHRWRQTFPAIVLSHCRGYGAN